MQCSKCFWDVLMDWIMKSFSRLFTKMLFTKTSTNVFRSVSPRLFAVNSSSLMSCGATSLVEMQTSSSLSCPNGLNYHSLSSIFITSTSSLSIQDLVFSFSVCSLSVESPNNVCISSNKWPRSLHVSIQ